MKRFIKKYLSLIIVFIFLTIRIVMLAIDQQQ